MGFFSDFLGDFGIFSGFFFHFFDLFVPRVNFPLGEARISIM